MKVVRNDAIFFENLYLQSLMCHKFRENLQWCKTKKWPFGLHKVYMKSCNLEMSNVNNIDFAFKNVIII